MNDPTPEQVAALKAYASSHGPLWRSDLKIDWMNGRTEGPLRQLRNSHGPSWLTRLKLEDLE